MEKSAMPNIPGMSAMTDTLEFVKNLWGGMKVPGVGIGGMPGMPGMVMPSLSVEEINKQIADLKAVESWLTVNMNMLRATIQALEVQSATLTTLKTMGDNLNTAMQNAAKKQPAAPKQSAAAAAQESEAKAEARRTARSQLKEEFKTAPPPEDKESAPSSSAAAPAAATESGSGNGHGHGDFGAPLANPAVWWNLLQDQFKQAVGSAMAAQPGTNPAASTAEPSAADKETKPKRKPRPKTH
jgi:hypothetical protein